ncbi:MAG: FHA domain-containing protein, partial [Myxococcota bacterium]|nr:FHA domain-containing protein [Myxococcota bacterium]
MIRLERTQGLGGSSSHESSADVVCIGRSPDNDVVLPDEHVSSEHARILFGGERYVLVDLGSTHGTAVWRGSQRIALDDSGGRELALESGDVIELGSAERVVQLAVTLSGEADPDPRVLAMRKIDELGRSESIVEGDTNRLRAVYEAQKGIGGAADLNQVLVAICDGAFALVPGATHV